MAAQVGRLLSAVQIINRIDAHRPKGVCCGFLKTWYELVQIGLPRPYSTTLALRCPTGLSRDAS